jgi:hypothetical protein
LPLAASSPGVLEQHCELKRFLFQNLYRHHKLVRMTDRYAIEELA